MAKVSEETKQDTNWARAFETSKQLGACTYPASWVLNFINEWNAAVARLRRQERGNMTLDDAIQHAKEVAVTQRNNQYCIKCAEEHEQLAEWLEKLKEYQQIEEQPTGYDVDKVVSELQSKSFERYGNQGMGGELVVNLDDAIEIVKRGGIDESK